MSRLHATLAFAVPIFVAIVGLIVRAASGSDIFDGMGLTLGAVAMGQIMPFLVFENLLVGKLLMISNSYSYQEGVLETKTTLAIDPKAINIDRARLLLVLFLLGCLIMWIGSIAWSLADKGNTMLPFRIGLGVLNVAAAWAFYVFV